ncbi:MAG: winged helix-turn-helix domain-containing protein [Chloroflexi bacterium]|nr:winged helix-turn-helix domain-containing protein [Chloroflexota bacterium]
MTEPRSVPEASPVARTPPVRRRSSTRGRERDPLLASIIRSKVEASPVRDQTLSRERLLGWLADHADDRLKLIIAEAGYGKTTLLADFARRDVVRCLWYKLESSDGDWVTFINYFIAACREVVPGFAPSTASLLRDMAVMNPSRDIVLGSLISELGALGEAPTMLILDDFHVVDESTDVAEMLGRLLERAPTSLTFLISSRRRPDLQLGRLAAKGELAQLTTDDLRFSPAETEELFASTYGHPLEPDLLRQVDARTEGWGASLQLLYSSIRSRPPAEVRSFIRVMSGAKGSLYDFLAEEVVGHLDPDMQRFVTRTALLQRVDPRYAAAILGASGAAESAEVVRLLMEAEDLGLLGRSSLTSVSRRFHPLLRDFLLGRLDEQTTSDERAEMHRRVAHVAETDDWLTACHHYIQAGDHKDAMRTLADAASEALGSGSWGAATEMLPSIKNVEIPPAVMALEARARAEVNPRAALDLLATVDSSAQPPETRALIRQIQAYACYRAGDFNDLRLHLNELLNDPSTPTSARSIARAYRAMLASHEGATLRDALLLITNLAQAQVRAGHHYYAGVSYHNAAVTALVQGDYRLVVQLAENALLEFQSTGAQHFEAQSTRAMLFTVQRELGVPDGVRQEVAPPLDLRAEGDADAFAEVGATLAVCGDIDPATELIAEARRRTAEGRTDLTAGTAVVWAELLLEVATGRYAAAQALAATATPNAAEVGYLSTWLARISLVALLAGEAEARELAERGIRVAERQGARRFEVRLRIVHAVASEDGPALRRALTVGAGLGALTLLETADAIAIGLYLFDEPPGELTESVRAWPHRWLPALRRALTSSHPPTSFAAARLLAEHGTREDIPRLVAFDRTQRKRLKGRRLARTLLSRVSPSLLVHDLGRVEYETDGRMITLSETRRKSAALLMYLVTRPQHTATREQVLDDLWPDAEPDAAANSLNQTLYFLRRDIDPWYDEHGSANYVSYESEIVWLDPALVTTDSATFADASIGALTGEADAARMAAAVRAYHGRFAPEFEYEEWSLAWRDQLHATYLAVVQALTRHLVAAGNLEGALRECQQALTVDPSSLDIEMQLIWLYGAIGTPAAAMRQYDHFARAYGSDIGAEPPSLAAVLGAGLPTGH